MPDDTLEDSYEVSYQRRYHNKENHKYFKALGEDDT